MKDEVVKLHSVVALTWFIIESESVPDLPLCFGVLPKNILRWIFAYVVQFLTIPKFAEHVFMTACVGLPGLPPSGSRKGPHNLTSTGPHLS